MQKYTFSKENSLALKGTAILMMMWHHCFLIGRFEKYSISFWPMTEGQVVCIADFLKICVSLFAFISGYGLYRTWTAAQQKEQSTSRWIYERLVRTLSSYWFVIVLAWLVCTFLDNRPYRIYNFATSILLGIWNMIVDFLGLTNLVGGVQLNPTWWYMSAAVVFIVLFPLIVKAFKGVGCFCTLGIILILPRISDGYPGGINFYSFLPVFCIGMIFARYDFFAIWGRLWSNRTIYIQVSKLIIMLAGLLIIYKLFPLMDVEKWWDVKWNLFPILVIIFAYDYLFKIPILNETLIFLGKHATNIFLVHAFIRYYYCEAFVYGRGNFIFIIGTLLLTSLGLSIVIEGLKKLLHYEAGINRLLLYRARSSSKSG